MSPLVLFLVAIYAFGMFYLAGEAYSYSKDNNKKLKKILKLLEDRGIVDDSNANDDINDTGTDDKSRNNPNDGLN
jgi:hypothetical protein